MSSDFYFRKWKKTLVDLESVVSLDLYLQKTKIHDMRLCEAAERLSGFLSHYMAIYNDVSDCLHQNLQVQKTRYMHEVLHAVVARIQELKHEICKLEVSEWHFSCNGLLHHKLTPNDAELGEIPDKVERPENIRAMLEDTFEKVREKKRLLEAKKEEIRVEEDKWWVTENEEKNENHLNTAEKKEKLSEEQLEMKRMVELIQAQERTRQVITRVRQNRNRREIWQKTLFGTLAPPAPYELKEKSAKLIKKVCRAYFESKRQKIIQCKRDEILGLTRCLKPKLENKEKFIHLKINRIHLKRKYDEESKIECENLKQEYLESNGEDIRECYRDHIRNWFRTWYDAIQLFHDIPGKKQGGAVLVFKEELPAPEEWLEEYKAYLVQEKSNKKKGATGLKAAKLEAKREEMGLRKAERMKKKMDEELRKKMMKNPTMHPGYYYPESKKTTNIQEVINKYYTEWADLDATGTLDVKERFVRNINKSHACMEAKIEIISTVEEDMRVPLPQNGEMRAIWWQKCRELVQGFHKILLVGAKGSGKNTLVHLLATMNDAVLFELDPGMIREECLTKQYLDPLVRSVVSCAKALQPSVIHVKLVHSLYYRKVPTKDAKIDWKLIQFFFVKKLFKLIKKTDKITVIGTCVEPWVSKTNPLLKQFPAVLLLPDTGYGTVVQILKDWVLSYTVIPPDLDVSCLAHVLQGYSLGFLKDALKKFMSAETIARIAANGLNPMDVYNFILQDESEGIVDYTQYQKWYLEKTALGRKEKKHQAEQLEFKQAMAKYTQLMAMKKKKQNGSTHSHDTA